MKHTLAALSLLCASLATASAQSARPNSFHGLAWGAGPSDVLAALARSGATAPPLEELPASPSAIEATGGTFAGQEVISWTFEFVGGKLFSGTVVLKPADTGGALYRELKQHLINKYGPSSAERRTGADTPEERRLRQIYGRSVVRTGTEVIWRFSPNLRDKESLSISCELVPVDGAAESGELPSVVSLRYTNETLKALLPKQPAVAAGTAAPEEPQKTGRPLKVDCL
jgi:hypothetical protein